MKVFTPYHWSSDQWLYYGLEDRDSIPGRARDLSLHHRVQTHSEAHPASYSTVTGNPFPSVKGGGCEGDHSHPSSAELKYARSYTSTPPHIFIAWCLIKQRIPLHRVIVILAQGQIYFHLTFNTCSVYVTEWLLGIFVQQISCCYGN